MDRFTMADEPAGSSDIRWCFEQQYRELGTGLGYDVDTRDGSRPRK